MESGLHEIELKVRTEVVSGFYIGISQAKTVHVGTVADADNLLFRMNGHFFNNKKLKKLCESLKPNVDYRIKFVFNIEEGSVKIYVNGVDKGFGI
jgi:hypothetical protein